MQAVDANCSATFPNDGAASPLTLYSEPTKSTPGTTSVSRGAQETTRSQLVVLALLLLLLCCLRYPIAACVIGVSSMFAMPILFADLTCSAAILMHTSVHKATAQVVSVAIMLVNTAVLWILQTSLMVVRILITLTHQHQTEVLGDLVTALGVVHIGWWASSSLLAWLNLACEETITAVSFASSNLLSGLISIITPLSAFPNFASTVLQAGLPSMLWPGTPSVTQLLLTASALLHLAVSPSSCCPPSLCFRPFYLPLAPSLSRPTLCCLPAVCCFCSSACLCRATMSETSVIPLLLGRNAGFVESAPMQGCSISFCFIVEGCLLTILKVALCCRLCTSTRCLVTARISSRLQRMVHKGSLRSHS